jgi:hypothetical protein
MHHGDLFRQATPATRVQAREKHLQERRYSFALAKSWLPRSISSLFYCTLDPFAEVWDEVQKQPEVNAATRAACVDLTLDSFYAHPCQLHASRLWHVHCMDEDGRAPISQLCTVRDRDTLARLLR